MRASARRSGSHTGGIEGQTEPVRCVPGDVHGRVACFTETRVSLSQLLGYLRDGCTIDDFSTITKDQAELAETLAAPSELWLNKGSAKRGM